MSWSSYCRRNERIGKKIIGKKIVSKKKKGKKRRTRIGRKIDYIASWNNIPCEVLLVEVAGGIAGGNDTKVKTDARKLYRAMKDSLDFYKKNLIPTETEWKDYSVYGLTING
jgi:hypothetical protein